MISLRSALEDTDAAAKACALLSIVGTINMVVIKYSVLWWDVLHQPPTDFTADNSQPNGPEIWVPLVIMFFGVYLFFVISLLLSMRNEVLHRERRAQWVNEIAA